MESTEGTPYSLGWCIQLPYLLVYKSTWLTCYNLNYSPKNGLQLIHKSYTKKKMGIDLYTSKYGICKGKVAAFIGSKPFWLF